MSPGFSMMGSGIYSQDKTVEVECQCEECDDQNGCGHAEEYDFSTDDYGNIDSDVICNKCKHTFNYTKEYDENEGYDEYDPDAYND